MIQRLLDGLKSAIGHTFHSTNDAMVGQVADAANEVVRQSTRLERNTDQFSAMIRGMRGEMAAAASARNKRKKL